MIPPNYVVRICDPKNGELLGTGVLVSPGGHVVTCWHVVKEAHLVAVSIPLGAPWQYQVLKKWPVHDLVLLEGVVPPGVRTPFAGIDQRWSHMNRVGEAVTVWGYSANDRFTAAQQYACTISGFSEPHGRIGLNGDLNPGDSGGPVVNSAGRVVAIAQVRDRARNGHALAIPIGLLPSGGLFPDAEVAPHCSLGRLPVPADPDLFVGRDQETGPIAELNRAWDCGAAIVQLVGFGGFGKSTVAYHWQKEVLEVRQCASAINWSFYSQGQHRYQTDSQAFFRAAIDHFSHFDRALEHRRTQWDKESAQALARVYCRPEVGGLVVLDGLEPLQHPQDVSEGRIRDTPLREFLNAVREAPVVAGAKERVLLITTRWPTGDLRPTRDGRVRVLNLPLLNPRDGAELLRGITLADTPGRRLRSLHELADADAAAREFERASEESNGNPLALILLGSFVLEQGDGYIEHRPAIGALAAIDQSDDPHRHARRILRDYANLFEAGDDRRRGALQLLCLLGLWDRPAPIDHLRILLGDPLPGVTDRLAEEGFERAVQQLRRLRFLTAEPQATDLNAHPLIREYFGEWLRKHNPDAWHTLHGRLFDYLRQNPATPDRPDTLDRMEPLFQAVVHGCKAGRHQQAIEEVLLPRILRHTENYAATKLGAGGQVLSVLSHFFEPNDWGRPVGSLSTQMKLTILLVSGLYLAALKGYGKESSQCIAGQRALDLGSEGPFSQELLVLLSTQWRYNIARGHLPTILSCARQMEQVASRGGAPSGAGDLRPEEVYPVRAMAASLMWAGRFAEADMYAVRGLNSPSLDGTTLSWQTTEPRVACRAIHAMNLWHLGLPDRAAQEIRKAVYEAREGVLIYPRETLPVAIYFQSYLHQLCGEPHLLRLAADELNQAWSDQTTVFRYATGMILNGWAMSKQGDAFGGAALMDDGIQAWMASGAEINLPYFRMLRADLWIDAGNQDMAIELLEDGLARSERQEENWCVPALSRELGRLERKVGADGWEKRYESALTLAERQRNRSVWLRLLTDLCEWGARSREQLRDAYDSFTEGHDTADLLRAKSVLDDGFGHAR